MAKKRQQKYKEAVKEIEDIISEIESETIDVDELASKVKRASELITFCKDKLKKTEKEVNKILEEVEEEPTGETEKEDEPEGLFE